MILSSLTLVKVWLLILAFALEPRAQEEEATTAAAAAAEATEEENNRFVTTEIMNN